MKKIISLLLVLCMVLGMSVSVSAASDTWDGTADTTWYNTADKIFTLTTAEQLAGLSTLSASGNTFSGKTIVLGSDMDMDGKQWTPIKQFSGTFDGDEHTVSNFTLDGTSGRAGFIQNLGEYPATVKNLTLSDVNGIAGSNQYFGILAANGHTSVLENVHIVDCKVTTSNKEAWVGGIYGYFNWTSATNCTVKNLEIDASNGAKFLGGFSGNMDQDLTISNVDIIGFKVTLDATNGACQLGGFTGQTQTGHRQPTFTNCDVSGLDIVAKGKVQLGGFIGDAGAHTIANNCTVEGKIDASGVTDDRSFIGGFMADSGWNNNESNKGGHKLTNCSADVDIVTGGSAAGGFIGSTTAYHPNDGGNRNMPITFSNCTATGSVTVADGATANIGGFAGEADRGTFTKCSATGTVNGSSNAGGFIGHIPSAMTNITIDSCKGSYYVTGAEGKTGGLIGFIEPNLVEKISLTGNTYYLEPIYNPADSVTDNSGNELKEVPVEPTPTPDDTTPSTPVLPPVVEEDSTDDFYYEEEEIDTHTSKADMAEYIDDLSKNDDTVSIELLSDDDTIGYGALKLAAEEGLSVELDGTDDGYFWRFALEEAALEGFKGSFKSYVDIDAGLSTSLKKILKDSKNYQIFKTEHEGEVPDTTTLGVKLEKELRSADELYLYLWNSDDKQAEEMNVTMYKEGNYLCMEIPHYSTYIITDAPIVGAIVVEEGVSVTSPVISVDKANPETGASDFVGVAAALAVVSVLGTAALNKRK